MGHDEFAVVESTFVQRFPIYSDGDVNAKPSARMRQLQYKLRPGEAGWVLKRNQLRRHQPRICNPRGNDHAGCAPFSVIKNWSSMMKPPSPST